MVLAHPSVAVVDVSLALKWVLDEPNSDLARRLLAEWRGNGIQPVVPSWFGCEVANTLYQRFRDGSLATIEDAEAAYDVVMRFVLVIADDPADARRAIRIALDAGQKQTYDAQYAALAERLGCELWTADDRFLDGTRGIVPVCGRFASFGRRTCRRAAAPAARGFAFVRMLRYGRPSMISVAYYSYGDAPLSGIGDRHHCTRGARHDRRVQDPCADRRR
ncbi:MAG: type II toxin-antitoxin system VapC family toxin [Dehalococcoidia bacterium]